MTPQNSYSTRRKNERDLKLDYFSHVFADFHRLDPESRAKLLEDLPKGLEAFVRQLNTSGEISPNDEQKLDWGEIAILEDKILSRQDDETVRRRTWQVRGRYARLVGAERYQLYLASGPPDEKNSQTSVESLRADLRRVLGATHFSYSLSIVRENMRKRIMKNAGWWTLGLSLGALITAALLLRFDDREFAGTICAVVLFGCIGAYISVQRRLQESPDKGDPIISALGLLEFHSSLKFSLISGGLFAVVLFFFFLGDFIKGDLFPDFKGARVPSGVPNWAKLFIWSLIAGFAERLIPDTLDRLVNQSGLTGKDTAIAAAVLPGQNKQPDKADEEADPIAELEKLGVKKQPRWTRPEDDPNRGRFGGKAEDAGWRLTATAKPEVRPRGVVTVDLTVEKATAGAQDFKQAVFHLSQDFKEATVPVDISSGKAQYTFQTFYQFVAAGELREDDQTVGHLSSPPGLTPRQVMLELDLATVWPNS